MTLRGCLQLLQASLYPSSVIAITLMPKVIGERGDRVPSEYQPDSNVRMHVLYNTSERMICGRSFQHRACRRSLGLHCVADGFFRHCSIAAQVLQSIQAIRLNFGRVSFSEMHSGNIAVAWQIKKPRRVQFGGARVGNVS